MASERNKHGLSRDIPDPVRRQVRQECGFGCVVCGSAIFDYHHMDEFVDVTEHNPKRIACLCGGCHGMVNRGRYSKEKIEEARANPRCRQTGFSWSDFDVGSEGLRVVFGSAIFINPVVVLRVFDEDLLQVRGPEIPGGPFRISGRFYDCDSKLIFTIKDNEWFGPTDSWDIETEGRTLTIRRQHRDIALKLTTIPPHGIVVERLEMFYEGVRIYVDKEGVSVGMPELAYGFRGKIIRARCCVGVWRGPNGRSWGWGLGERASWVEGDFFNQPRSPQGDK